MRRGADQTVAFLPTPHEAKLPFSRYLMPPWIMWLEAEDAPETKSPPRSTRQLRVLESKVTERRDAIDAAANDEYIGGRAGAQACDGGREPCTSFILRDYRSKGCELLSCQRPVGGM